MGMLTPHRKFISPGNMDGIPQVRPRGPLPQRDQPLPGTKAIVVPEDNGFAADMSRHARQREWLPSRSARPMGWLAMASVVAFLAILRALWRSPDFANEMDRRDFLTVFVIFCLGGTHVLAIFSQIASAGRNMMGALSLLVLYGGFFLLAVLDHLLA